MDLNFEKKGQNLVIYMSGEMDHHSLVEIREGIDNEFLRSNSKNIIFDFSGVNFVDSSGVGMLIGRYKMVSGLGGKTALTGVLENVDRVFNISGVYKIIRKYASKEDAIKSL
ncbi:MAG: anti-sigma factor antagonist [Lachnospiraceae bacterium]|nr:anti-sigma factor antagonist [Lachnospiraceae bacterium]